MWLTPFGCWKINDPTRFSRAKMKKDLQVGPLLWWPTPQNYVAAHPLILPLKLNHFQMFPIKSKEIKHFSKWKRRSRNNSTITGMEKGSHFVIVIDVSFKRWLFNKMLVTETSCFQPTCWARFQRFSSSSGNILSGGKTTCRFYDNLSTRRQIDHLKYLRGMAFAWSRIWRKI